jgi:hypothetical protein
MSLSKGQSRMTRSSAYRKARNLMGGIPSGESRAQLSAVLIRAFSASMANTNKSGDRGSLGAAHERDKCDGQE